MSAQTLTGRFQTRRDAEMAVEHLVQDYGLDRERVHVRPESEENTAGTVASGADAAIRHRGSGAPGDPEGDIILPEAERETKAETARHGAMLVSAEVDEAHLERARAAIRDYGELVEDGPAR